jgi:hypothetical protein
MSDESNYDKKMKKHEDDIKKAYETYYTNRAKSKEAYYKRLKDINKLPVAVKKKMDFYFLTFSLLGLGYTLYGIYSFKWPKRFWKKIVLFPVVYGLFVGGLGNYFTLYYPNKYLKNL